MQEFPGIYFLNIRGKRYGPSIFNHDDNVLLRSLFNTLLGFITRQEYIRMFDVMYSCDIISSYKHSILAHLKFHLGTDPKGY